MKHTKGKWRYINQTTQTGDYYKVTSDTVSICNVTTRDGQQAEANSKLIAAAPELLEALIKIRSWAIAHGLHIEGKLILDSDNAIKKATE